MHRGDGPAGRLYSNIPGCGLRRSVGLRVLRASVVFAVPRPHSKAWQILTMRIASEVSFCKPKMRKPPLISIIRHSVANTLISLGGCGFDNLAKLYKLGSRFFWSRFDVGVYVLGCFFID